MRRLFVVTKFQTVYWITASVFLEFKFGNISRKLSASQLLHDYNSLKLLNGRTIFYHFYRSPLPQHDKR